MAPRIEIIRGDITDQALDAIVNAANSSLRGGGGVDGAIHRVGGPTILAACEEIRRTTHPGGLPCGEAVATTAGDLPARWVIHTVGPVYSGSEGDPRSLAACHINVLGVADRIGARTVAFPAISTGAYGYPIEKAAAVALTCATSVPTEVELVRFVLWDEDSKVVFEETLAAMQGPEADDATQVPARTSPGDVVDAVLGSLGGLADGSP
jgi:O-acetyl-ADP-ribose deacetylase (regulator of RNase III)